MATKYSEPIPTVSVAQEISSLIMQQFHSAFLRVAAASDALEPGAENASAIVGFNAYYAVQDAMKALDGTVDGLTVEFTGNRQNSSHHAELRYKGIVATFASAHREDGMPRHAQFREDLVQTRFDITDDGDLAPSFHNRHEAYVQFVYGRRGHELHFVKAVCVTSPEKDVLFLYRMGESDQSSEQEHVQEANWFAD